jgi:LysR family transcriptional activator of mexEF-oprN operon
MSVRIDLNLFAIFEALMLDRSVTGAARRLGLSQPAVSEALARLRRQTGDELFVRTPRGMTPTPRALALEGQVGHGLALLRAAAAPEPAFEPAAAQRTFRLAANDYAEIVILPRLLAGLRRSAPQVDIRILASDPQGAQGFLDAGEADLAIDIFARPLPKRFARATLLSDQAVCLLRPDHPALAHGVLALGDYVGHPHVARSFSGRLHSVPIDSGLAALGLRRRVAVTVTNIWALADVLRQTDLIATQPARIARALAGHVELAITPCPLPTPGWAVEMVWGRAAEREPGLAWLRGRLAAVCGSLDPPPADHSAAGTSSSTVSKK